MHELVLFGQVSQTRHDQVLKILAGIAAMQPQRVVERHAVYKPTREPAAPGRQGQVGGVQNVAANDKRTAQSQATKDLYYAQLVQSLVSGEDDVGGEGPLLSSLDTTPATKKKKSEGQWSIQFYDVPDSAKRPVLLRMCNTTTITEGDAHAYMKALSYNYVNEYILEGHRYIHENVVVLLHRVLLPPDPQPPLQAPNPSLPKLEALSPLDPSGAYVLQASVRLTDNPGPDIINRGQVELLKFQNDVKGIVDLKPVDRLALDTRVKSTAVKYQ